MEAYVKGFAYDIFISYAHADNLKFSGQNEGWVDQFYEDLTIEIHRKLGSPPKIWWDTRLIDGAQVFDDTIKAGVNEAAVLICLHTKSYLSSAYCKQELSLFFEKGLKEETGLQLGDRSRIVNVLLQDIPRNEWPKELEGRTGFSFYKKKDTDQLGNPLHIIHDNEKYLDRLEALGDAVSKIMLAFPIQALTQTGNSKVPATQIKKFSIYFGDVVDSLDTLKTRTIADLESKGFEVNYNIPPPFDIEPHETAVVEAVKKSNLTVHLLEAYPGKAIFNGDGASYSQKQAELGLAHGKNQLIWVPGDLAISSIEKESYKTFISNVEAGNHPAKNLEYIRGERSMLMADVVAHASDLKLQMEKAAAQEKFSILLDTHYKDQQYALELSKALLENEICPYIDPQSDDPHENIDILKIRIAKVKKLVFLYGKVTQEWLEERLNTTFKLLLDNKYPRKEFFVILLPPLKSLDQNFLEHTYHTIKVIDNSQAAQLEPNIYRQLL